MLDRMTQFQVFNTLPHKKKTVYTTREYFWNLPSFPVFFPSPRLSLPPSLKILFFSYFHKNYSIKYYFLLLYLQSHLFLLNCLLLFNLYRFLIFLIGQKAKLLSRSYIVSFCHHQVLSLFLHLTNWKELFKVLSSHFKFNFQLIVEFSFLLLSCNWREPITFMF